MPRLFLSRKKAAAPDDEALLRMPSPETFGLLRREPKHTPNR